MANRIVLGNLVIDRDRFEVWIAEQPVGLTFAEFELLFQLARNAGKVVSTDSLVSKLWGDGEAHGARKLRVHISRLRKKIRESDPWQIRTIAKRGYGLVNPASEARLPPFALTHAPVRPKRPLGDGQTS
jgi:two-component system alkaline phosphatase synthesis response regulator PhoP